MHAQHAEYVGYAEHAQHAEHAKRALDEQQRYDSRYDAVHGSFATEHVDEQTDVNE